MSSLLRSLGDNGTALVLETAHYPDLAESNYIQEGSITPASARQALKFAEQRDVISEGIKEVVHRLKSESSINPMNAISVSLPAFVALVNDLVLVSFAQQIIWRSVGRVALYICPDPVISNEFERIVTKAANLAWAAEQYHIATKDRVYISVPATWEGIQAAKELKSMHIECTMTMVVDTTQALLCAEAGIARISPPVAAIKRWHIQHGDDNPFVDLDDIKHHPGIIFVKRMAEIFKRRNYSTMIVPQDFSSVEEVVALAGLPKISIPVSMVRELGTKAGVVVNSLDRVRGINFNRDQNSLPRPTSGVNPGRYNREWFYQECGKMTTDLLDELLSSMKKESDELYQVIEERVRSNPEASTLLSAGW